MDSVILMVCLLGIICALSTIFLNINLVFRIVLNKSKRNVDMQLFYYRFVLDIFFGTCCEFIFKDMNNEDLFSVLFYIVFILLSIEAPMLMEEYRDLIVYLAIPWSNFAACRSIIALSISTERVIAAYFPISYRNIKNSVPTWSILLVAISFGLSEELVLFEFCSYNMVIPLSCRVFGCAVNKCFYNFWTIHKTVIFCMIVILSVLLSVKIFIWNNLKHTKTNSQLSKANRLALLDTITVLIFDFLPSFCGSMWPTAKLFSFDYVGPYNAVGKVTGCAIEAIVVSTLLIFRKTRISENISTSIRRAIRVKNSKSSRLA
ncbi:hypothetical protein CRE_19014 [Caenorhabditis remanei]|uniref:Uncharacterized protein n=1 Tax=Caenorhabditis remanei TaxID=31234 RepID=E3LL43_CAERE|nr:hypothetical protein CRE_19014 [Caenorhabditis remanei]